MIHADFRRDALQRWLSTQLGGARFALTPASEDASFRRYFRATLDDGASYVAMDAPPEKEDCRPFLHVAALLREAGVHARVFSCSPILARALIFRSSTPTTPARCSRTPPTR